MSDHALAVLAAVIGIAGILIGFFISYYFYVKGKERADPRYVWGYGPLLKGHQQYKAGDMTQHVSLLINGERVEDLNRCLLALWNKGSRTLRGSDIVDSDQTRVVFPAGSRVLDAGVIESTRQSIGFTAIIDETDRNVLIKFDFLDRGDGGLIQILYQGDPDLRPEVTGSIRGVPEGVRMLSGSIDFSDDTDEEDTSTWKGWLLIVPLFLLAGSSSISFGFGYPLTVVLLTFLGEMLITFLAVRLFGTLFRRSIDFPNFAPKTRKEAGS